MSDPISTLALIGTGLLQGGLTVSTPVGAFSVPGLGLSGTQVAAAGKVAGVVGSTAATAGGTAAATQALSGEPSGLPEINVQQPRGAIQRDDEQRRRLLARRRGRAATILTPLGSGGIGSGSSGQKTLTGQ